MSDKGDFESAQRLLHESLALKGEVGDTAGLASSLSNLGRTYSAIWQIDKALEYYQKAAHFKKGLETAMDLPILSVILGKYRPH
jgi:tetratricopeptide (TPR) repeat protein